jgi:hypothetical protein
MIPNAVYNDGGLVSLWYYQPIPKYLKLGNKDYVFQCKFGIAMIFVPEDEVQQFLDFKGGCCGSNHQVIFLANSAQYSHWLRGDGGR